MSALTDYRVVPVNIIGRRGGLTPVWQIHTGPYHKLVGQFISRREALDELARLVNEAAVHCSQGEGYSSARNPTVSVNND